MDYYNIDEFLDFSLDTLTGKRCILFLGPRFGKTADGLTAGEAVRQLLMAFPNRPGQTPLIDNLDEEFDNLFILRDAGAQSFQLKGLLAKHYRSLEPGEVYKTIAQLPFRAVICCTPDLMLKKTYDNLGQEVDFHYYSHQGQEERAVKEGVPVLYNLFGTPDNQESLMVTYEAFFRFVVSILGPSDQLPSALQYIFQEADIFMLLGFDLNKWYIPLIVRKLNQSKGAVMTQRSSVLTLDTSFRPEAEFKMSTSVIVVENQTDEVLQRISAAISDKEPQPRAGQTAERPTKAQITTILDAAQELLQNTEPPKAIQLLLNNADPLALDKAAKNDLRVMQFQVLNAQRAFSTQQISFNDLNGTLNKSVAELLRLIDSLRETLGVAANP